MCVYSGFSVLRKEERMKFVIALVVLLWLTFGLSYLLWDLIFGTAVKDIKEVKEEHNVGPVMFYLALVLVLFATILAGPYGYYLGEIKERRK